MKSKEAILNHLFYPEKLGNGAAASSPFLRILRTKSIQTGEYKTYITTTNVLSTEDGQSSLTNMYRQYPIPDLDYTSEAILSKIPLAIEKVLRAKLSGP